jgi:hypothetical protein
MDEPLRTVISEYANSPTILQLVINANGYLDPKADFDAFVRLIWDLRTAEGVGLDIWGRIVGVDRTLNIPGNEAYFGYQTGDSSWEPFGQAPFVSGTPVTQNYVLSDEAYRTLIFVKAASNIAATTAPAINALLRRLFVGRGRVYVNDLGNMQMRYTFEFYLQPYEMALMTQSGALPRPAGVEVFLLQAPDGEMFGFAEAGDTEPFGQATFLSQENLVHAI